MSLSPAVEQATTTSLASDIPGSALCHKGGRTFGDLKPDVFVTPAMTFSAAKEGVTHYPEKLQFNGSKFLGAAGPVEQGKVTEGCEAQGYSQPGTSRRKMQPRKRSSALVRSQERAAAARAVEPGSLAAAWASARTTPAPSPGSLPAFAEHPWSSLRAPALPGAVFKLATCPSLG